MNRILTILALAFFVATLWASPVQETVEEPKSDVEFPLVLTEELLSADLPEDSAGFPTKLRAMSLCGMGLRTKTWFDVKVYAMGLYWDTEVGREKFSGWAGKTAKELAGDGEFYTALLEGRSAMTLRLVMCRDVDGDDMAEAFDDSLAPRMKQAIEKDKKRGALEDLAKFRSHFSVDEVKEDVELLFTWTTEGKLHTRMEGKYLGTLDSPALCWSLFDVYLGSDPISKKAKKSLVERVPALLAAAEKE
jgi:hypothetical protein